MAADDGREHYEKLYSSYWALPHFRFEYNKFKHRVKAIVADNAVRIAPNDTAVDLGCGLGPKTYVLSEFFAHTTGIDFIQNCGPYTNSTTGFSRTNTKKPRGLRRRPFCFCKRNSTKP